MYLGYKIFVPVFGNRIFLIAERMKKQSGIVKFVVEIEGRPSS